MGYQYKETPCQFCSHLVLRRADLELVTCFDCKQKRRKKAYLILRDRVKALSTGEIPQHDYGATLQGQIITFHMEENKVDGVEEVEAVEVETTEAPTESVESEVVEPETI